MERDRGFLLAAGCLGSVTCLLYVLLASSLEAGGVEGAFEVAIAVVVVPCVLVAGYIILAIFARAFGKFL